MAPNLYVHFPFCRRKCAYCALYSRAGVGAEARDDYVRRLAKGLDGAEAFRTVYFGGGTPSLCNLRPIFDALCLTDDAEFTVEVHPLDVSETLLKTLRAGGVNRISMGVESLDDATLRAMGRGYTVREAETAFRKIRSAFDNAGIDLIVGFPGDPCDGWERLRDWGLRHCSVYSLQNERRLKDVPSDDFVLDKIRVAERFLGALGLRRYEISNYAVPGFECRHNLAVWRGEDYIGLGEGACGRIGRLRTRNAQSVQPPEHGETLSPERDEIERRIFRLRTYEGLETAGHPSWPGILAPYVQEGLLTRKGTVYHLTPRGREVCDTILADLVL